MIDLKLSENTTIGFLVDVSGGIDDKLIQNFQPIIKGNISPLKGFTAKIAAFDDRLRNTATISPENLSDIDSFTTFGGGGTNIDPAMDWCGEADEYVVFTDGFLWSFEKLLEVKEKISIVLYPGKHQWETDEFEDHFFRMNSMGFKRVIKG